MHKSQQNTASSKLLTEICSSPAVKAYGRKSMLIGSQIPEQTEEQLSQQTMSILKQSERRSTVDEVYVPFKEKYPQFKREQWFAESRIKFPNKIAVILETTTPQDIRTYWQYFTSFIHSFPMHEMAQIKNPKFLVPLDFEIRNITTILKEKLDLEKKDAVILFASNTVLKPDRLLSDVYEKYKDSDGFLYLKYIKEDSFGFQPEFQDQYRLRTS